MSEVLCEVVSETMRDNLPIYLTYNSIGDEGDTALGVALHHNTTITSLFLSRNLIGYEGATALGRPHKKFMNYFPFFLSCGSTASLSSSRPPPLLLLNLPKKKKKKKKKKTRLIYPAVARHP